MNEVFSTMLLLFSPSALILFGDPAKKPSDSLMINQKYPNCNLNQSMFERLRTAKRCVLHLNAQHRFGEEVSKFLSSCFYNGHGIGHRRNCSANDLDFVGIYHRKTDGFCFKFIKNMLKIYDPKALKYGIIHPPNIQRESITEILG